MVRTKTFAFDIDDAVKKDLHNHFFVCDTTKFLDNVLPVPKSCVDEVLKKLRKDSVYKNGRWARMPASDSAGEDKHYEPFIDIANAISDAVKASTGFTGDRRVNGVWVDRHSKSPKSPDEDAANTRPDCVNVTSSAVIEELDDAIALARQERDKAGASAADKRRAQVKMNRSESEKEKEKQNMSVWWRQVHVPVELKAKYGEKDWLEACTQLCRYMRQVLGEQLDRRFVVGLMLCFDQLTVLLSDRSGILGTSTPINIHKNPRQFIQVIASFTVLAAHQIGWDPAMEVYDPESGTPRPSYQVDNNSRIFGENKYQTRWVIDIPSKEGKREKVITVRTLSAARSEVMVGRATLVWEVVKYEERFKPTQIFVLKRYWRPYRNPSSEADIPLEADRYRLFDSAEERLYSYEDITIDGNVDSTLEWIRKNMASEARQYNIQKIGSKRVRDEDGEDAEPYLHVVVTDPGHPTHFSTAASPRALVSRAHTQLVIPHSGWAIRHFKSLLELVQVMLAAVKDHHSFYKKGGVHRDVSSGNIIIMPTDGDNTTGRLIDFDHAKVTEEFAAIGYYDEDVAPPQVYQAILSRNRQVLAYSIDDDIIIKALQAVGPLGVLHYVPEVITMRRQFFNLGLEGKVMPADLHWNKADVRQPRFTDHEARSGHRTGTLPYMSAEVMTAKFNSKIFLQKDALFFHDAAHDIESFLWVLVNLCLTRKGPGISMIRDELLPNQDVDDPRDKTLDELVYRLFDSNTDVVLLEKKQTLLEEPGSMNSVVEKFHPYFAELKPMVLQWWHTLVLAYRFRAYEYIHIHSHIIDILEGTIERLKQIEATPKDLAATQKEIERRQKHRNNVLDTFVPKDPLMTPPHTPGVGIDMSPERTRLTRYPQQESSPRPKKRSRKKN